MRNNNYVKPKISIIIPVYNVEDYVEDCLQSVLNQTMDDYEVICIDDGSTDDSVKIIKDYSSRFRHFVLCEHKVNKGLSAARNTGIENSSGEYLFFLDSDDFIEPDTLEVLAERMDSDQLDMLFFDFDYFFNPKDEIIPRSVFEDIRGIHGVFSGQDLFVRMINERRFYVYACFRIYRTEFIKSNSIWFVDKMLHEDYLFYLDCMLSAKRVACYPHKFYHYRRRRGQITNNSGSLRLQSFFYIFMEIFNRWRNGNYSPEVKSALGRFAKHVYYRRFLSIKEVVDVTDDSMTLGHEADDFLYHILMNLGGEEPKYIHITKEQLEQISDSKKVYIYGAGNYGKELYRELERRNIYVESFLITEQPVDNRLLFGKRIICVNEWSREKDSLIIIAANPKIRMEIKNHLDEMGISEYMLLRKPEEVETTDFWELPIVSEKILFLSYGTVGRYSDHGKYITEELLKKNAKMDIVWAVNDGNDPTIPTSVRQINIHNREAVCREAATAGIWVCNNPLTPYLVKREGQVYIQTKHWASITLKRFYLDDDSFKGDGDYHERWRKGFSQMDYLLSGSDFDEESCRKGFEFKGECIRVGSPRSDVMFREQECKAKVCKHFGIDTKKKICLYSPTHRYKEGTRIAIGPDEPMDYERLVKNLRKRFGGEWVLLIRMHPLIANNIAQKYAYGENVVDASSYLDGQELASTSEVMISDYSSIMFEPSFVGKLTVLYAPDRKDYIGIKKEFLLDYDCLPFPRAETNEELEKVILELDMEEYKEKVSQFLASYDVKEDGHASERAAKFIMGLI